MDSLYNNPKYADVAVDIVKASDPEIPLITFYLQTDLLKSECEKLNAVFSLEWSSTLTKMNRPSFEKPLINLSTQIINYKLLVLDHVADRVPEEDIPRIYKDVFGFIYQSRFTTESANYSLDDWLVFLSIFEEMICPKGINKTAAMIIEKVGYDDKQAIQKLIEYNNRFPNSLIATHIRKLGLVNGFTIEDFKVIHDLTLLESAFKSCQMKGFPPINEVKECLFSRFPASGFDVQTDVFKLMCRIHGSEELLWKSLPLERLLLIAQNPLVLRGQCCKPLFTTIASIFCEFLTTMSHLSRTDECYNESKEKVQMIPVVFIGIFFCILDNAILSNMKDIHQTNREIFYNYIVALDSVIYLVKIPQTREFINSIILSNNNEEIDK